MLKGSDVLDNPLVLITSYDLMAKCGSQLMAMNFGVIILVRRSTRCSDLDIRVI
jgi:hypothetical protein